MVSIAFIVVVSGFSYSLTAFSSATVGSVGSLLVTIIVEIIMLKYAIAYNTDKSMRATISLVSFSSLVSKTTSERAKLMIMKAAKIHDTI